MQDSYLPKFTAALQRAKLVRPLTTSLLLICLLLLTGTFYGCAPAQPLPWLRYDLQAAPESLDPQFAASSASSLVIANLFEGLVRLSEDGTPELACAEEYELSQDQRVYTFHLRKDLFWQDGSALMADDFVFAFWRLFDPKAPSTAAASYGSIENSREVLAGEKPLSALGVTAPDDHTVVFRLSVPDLSLLTLLAEPAAMPCPQQFFRAQKGRYGLNDEAVMGNGPFTLKSWSDKRIELERSERYRQPPQIGGVNLYIDRGDPVDLFLKQRSDLCLIPYQRISQGERETGTMFPDQSWVLLVNPDSEAGRQKPLRAALLGVLDPASLSKILPEGLSAASGLVSPALMLHGTNYRALAGAVHPAPAVSDPRALLLCALEERGLEKLPRTTLLVSDFSPGPELGGAMQSVWRETLSAHINMEQLSDADLQRRVEAGRFDLALLPIPASGSSPAGVLARFAREGLSETPLPDADAASEQQTAVPAPASPEPTFLPDTVGRMLEQARQCTDSAEAAARYLAIEQAVIDDYAVMPIFDAPSLFSQRAGLSGVVRIASSGSVFFGGAVLTTEK